MYAYFYNFIRKCLKMLSKSSSYNLYQLNSYNTTTKTNAIRQILQRTQNAALSYNICTL